MDVSALQALITQQLAAQNKLSLDLIRQNAATKQAIADLLLQQITVPPKERVGAVDIEA